MTAPQAPEQTPGDAAQPEPSCPRCGAAVRPDQDWCLNCGAAVTTHVAGAPGWRTPVAIVGAVLAFAAAALVFAFLEISGDAEQEVAQAPTPAATAEPSPVPTVDPGATPGSEPTPETTPDGELPGSDPGGEDDPTGSTDPLDPVETPEPSDDPAGDEPIGSWPPGRSPRRG